MRIRRFIINLSNPSADTTAPGYASSEIGDGVIKRIMLHAVVIVLAALALAVAARLLIG
jgi:hypothetical protein